MLRRFIFLPVKSLLCQSCARSQRPVPSASRKPRATTSQAVKNRATMEGFSRSTLGNGRRSATSRGRRRESRAGKNGTEGEKRGEAPEASPGKWDGDDGGDFLQPQGRTDHPDARVARGCPARVGGQERASANSQRLAAKSERGSNGRLNPRTDHALVADEFSWRKPVREAGCGRGPATS